MFIVLAAALATAKRWGNITDPSFDTDISVLLEASKATESYRPFAVAAYWVATAATTTRGLLWEASGEAKFLKPDELDALINRLLALQDGFDRALTDIPPGWELAGLKATICKGCADSQDAVPEPFTLGLIIA
jgi:hypothetical protein